MTARRFAILFLSAQAVGASAWWALLFAWPPSRAHFKAGGAPDSTLLAFAAPDLLLYAGGSAACAFGLATKRRWAWPLLCAHAGAAGYAALYCLGLVGFTSGDGWLGAAFMAPSLVVPGVLVWLLRPRE